MHCLLLNSYKPTLHVVVHIILRLINKLFLNLKTLKFFGISFIPYLHQCGDTRYRNIQLKHYQIHIKQKKRNWGKNICN